MTDKLLVHVIDDEESVRRGTSFFLKTSGYAVRTWEAGVEFLKEVRHVEKGCVLLDIGMPEMDGLEVQRQLNARGVTMPVIVLTGHGDIAVAVKAMKAGAIDYLPKPADADAIEAALVTRDRALPPPPVQPMSADRVRWEHIQRVFEQCERNVSETARRLNMHRRTLQRILSKHTPRE